MCQLLHRDGVQIDVTRGGVQREDGKRQRLDAHISARELDRNLVYAFRQRKAQAFLEGAQRLRGAENQRVSPPLQIERGRGVCGIGVGEQPVLRGLDIHIQRAAADLDTADAAAVLYMLQRGVVDMEGPGRLTDLLLHFAQNAAHEAVYHDGDGLLPGLLLKAKMRLFRALHGLHSLASGGKGGGIAEIGGDLLLRTALAQPLLKVRVHGLENLLLVFAVKLPQQGSEPVEIFVSVHSSSSTFDANSSQSARSASAFLRPVSVR